MKINKLILLFILIFVSIITKSQDFEFYWETFLFPTGHYRLTVLRNGKKSTIEIFQNQYSGKKLTTKKLKKEDCDSVYQFLMEYDFPVKGSTVYGPKIREYHETVTLPDTNWLIVNGDSLRKEIMWVRGYEFDLDSNKCYSESQMISSWTDGNDYEGKLTTSAGVKLFSVYCARVSKLDYDLNRLIYNLIIKYDKINNYEILRENIESEKPRN